MSAFMGLLTGIAATVLLVGSAYFVVSMMFGVTLSVLTWMAIALVVGGFSNVLMILVADWIDA